MSSANMELPVAHTSSKRQGGWTQVEPLVFQRPCIGLEHSASYQQNITDGHDELSVAMPFSVNLSIEDLIVSCKRAWIHCRNDHPEIAIELSTDLVVPQMMTYQHLTHTNAPEEQQWLDETFRVVLNRSYQDVHAMTLNTQLQTRGKRSVMWLVLDTRAGLMDSERTHCAIWHVSQAVTDASNIASFSGHFLDLIIKNASDTEWSSRQSQDAAAIVRRLPVSPTEAYEQAYTPTNTPTKEELKQAVIQAKQQLKLYREKIVQSVAMYPEADYQTRDHYTECLSNTWTKKNSDALLRSLQRYNVSIEYAGAAATIMAACELFKKGHETGALVGMTRHAGKWIASVSVDAGKTPTSMSTDVVYLWIPIPKNLTVCQFSRRRLLLAIGQEIATQMEEHLRSPHYLSALPYTSKALTDGLLAQKMLDEAAESHGTRQGEDSANLVDASAPAFSSQGKMQLPKYFVKDGTALVRHDVINATRQTGSSPWVSMCSLDERLKFSMAFDAKYYKSSTMRQFMYLVQENMSSALDCDSTSKL